MRTFYALALVATLALPRVAHAQTPSVTPTPAPVTLTFRFNCDSVPWSCGDGPNDVRWQLYEVVGCDDPHQTGCRYERVGAVVPGQTVALWPRHRYKLFLAPNQDRSDRVARVCSVPFTAETPYLSIHSMCTLNETVCAGPENWQIYGASGSETVHAHKHIGDCSRFRFYPWTITSWVIAWGLPGELASGPTTAATMTPLPTATLTPTVGIPTEVPTLAVTPTTSPPATDAPTATVTASATSSPTATPKRGVLLLPVLGR